MLKRTKNEEPKNPFQSEDEMLKFIDEWEEAVAVLYSSEKDLSSIRLVCGGKKHERD